MKHRTRMAALAAGVAGMVLAGGGVAYADLTATVSSTVIHGCFSRSGGALRIVSASAHCTKSEQALAWNQRGPVGPQGPKGDPGAKGDPGVSGYHQVSGSGSVPGLVAQEVRAYCNTGEVAIGGGYWMELDANLTRNTTVTMSRPVSDPTLGDYWAAQLDNFNDPNTAGSTATFHVYANCVKVQ